MYFIGIKKSVLFWDRLFLFVSQLCDYKEALLATLGSSFGALGISIIQNN
jgi:hypothetical protein